MNALTFVRVLTQDEIEAIHKSTLRILENVNMGTDFKHYILFARSDCYEYSNI